MKSAVLGAGSWGTTFAQVLCDALHPFEVVLRVDVIDLVGHGIPFVGVRLRVVATREVSPLL